MWWPLGSTLGLLVDAERALAQWVFWYRGRNLRPPPRRRGTPLHAVDPRATDGAAAAHPYLSSKLCGIGVLVVDRSNSTSGSGSGSSALDVGRELAARGALVALALTPSGLAACGGAAAAVTALNRSGAAGAGRGKGCAAVTLRGGGGDADAVAARAVTWIRGNMHMVIYMASHSSGYASADAECRDDLALFAGLAAQDGPLNPDHAATRVVVNAGLSAETPEFRARARLAETIKTRHPRLLSILVQTPTANEVAPLSCRGGNSSNSSACPWWARNSMCNSISRCCCPRARRLQSDAVLSLATDDAADLEWHPDFPGMAMRWHYTEGALEAVAPGNPKVKHL